MQEKQKLLRIKYKNERDKILKTNNMIEQNSAAVKSSASPAKKIIILVTLAAREHNNLLRSLSILSNQMNLNGSKANELQLNKAEDN